MQLLVSKFIYLKDLDNLERTLLPFKNLAIQLAFFKKEEFFKLNHQAIKDLCKILNIKIPTIHAPTIDVFDEDFLGVIELIKSIYNVKVISIHPQKGDRLAALSKLEKYAKIILDLDVILAYENFNSKSIKRKWIVLPTEMYKEFKLPFLKITFDTSHLDNPQDCLLILDKIFDKVEVIHLSDNNLKQSHLPLGRGKVNYRELLKYLKEKNFSGFLVLEYLEEFQNKLLEDLKVLEEFLK